MLMIKTLTSQAELVHQAVNIIGHHPQRLLSIDARTIKKDHGLVVHQDGIIVGHLIGETVMEGDQDLVVEIGIDADDQDPVVGIETDVDDQDQAVKSGVDEHQDLVVQIEEVTIVPLHDSIEDHHPQDTG